MPLTNRPPPPPKSPYKAHSSPPVTPKSPSKAHSSPPVQPQKARFSPPLRPLAEGGVLRRTSAVYNAPTQAQIRNIESASRPLHPPQPPHRPPHRPPHQSPQIRRRRSVDEPPLEEIVLPPLVQNSNYTSFDSNEPDFSPPHSPTGWNQSSQAPQSLKQALAEASLLLPKQAILANFVHRNPWEMLQSMDWTDALSHIESLLSALSPMERCFRITGTDPRILANPALAEISALYLDLGLAKWAAPNRSCVTA